MTATLGRILLLLSLATPAHRVAADGCTRAFCRCIPPAGLYGPNRVEVRDLAARVAVSRTWKGLRVDTLTVVFGSRPIASSCDLSLDVGSSYVIFAEDYGDGVLRTRQCTGAASGSDAAATIAALGPGQESK